MTLRNTSASFGAVARTLHWGMAVLIIVSLALIESTDFAPKGSALKVGLKDWHAQIGLVVLALVWFRLYWKIVNVEPAIVPVPPAWQLKVAHAVEWTFYAVMFVQPLLGIVMLQADGKAVGLLGLHLPVFVATDRPWAHQLEDVHAWSGNTMMVLIGVHVAAARWHSLVVRDNTLTRMR